MDPALPFDNFLCERMVRNPGYQSPDLKNKLYISSAHNAPYGKRDKSPFRLSQDNFCKALKEQPGVNLKHDYFENQNHLTVPYQSLYAGLAWIFPDFYILDNPRFVLEVPFIENHYKRESDTYGIVFTPAERLMEMFGKYFLYDKNDYTKSLEFFQFNTTHYPTSSRAFEFLAKAYEALGDTDKATLNYKKALELNPGNTDIQKTLNKDNRLIVQ
jgi:tetratricopeptide (TPR) repeat protein